MQSVPDRLLTNYNNLSFTIYALAWITSNEVIHANAWTQTEMRAFLFVYLCTCLCVCEPSDIITWEFILLTLSWKFVI